jgi:hypothetical protein
VKRNLFEIIKECIEINGVIDSNFYAHTIIGETYFVAPYFIATYLSSRRNHTSSRNSDPLKTPSSGRDEIIKKINEAPAKT